MKIALLSIITLYPTIINSATFEKNPSYNTRMHALEVCGSVNRYVVPNFVCNIFLSAGFKVWDSLWEHGTKKLTETIVDTYFISQYYPRMKRYALKTSMPDAFYMATEVVNNGSRISDLVLNKQTKIKISTYVDSLRYAVTNGKGMPSLLLYGPPGTGKTEIAKRLSAEGTFDIKMFSGGGLSRLLSKDFEHIFQWVARKHERPVILFIDEAETLLKKTLGRRTDQLQTFLTATGSRSTNFAVVVATNFVEELDDSAHRRFNVVVEVALPQAAERTNIITLYLKQSIASDPKVTVEDNFFDDEKFMLYLSKISEGLSGSDLENICKNSVSQSKHFDKGMLFKSTIISYIEDIKRETNKLLIKKQEIERNRREAAKYSYYEAMARRDDLEQLSKLSD